MQHPTAPSDRGPADRLFEQSLLHVQHSIEWGFSGANTPPALGCEAPLSLKRSRDASVELQPAAPLAKRARIERDPDAADPRSYQCSTEGASRPASSSDIDDEIVASVVRELQRVPDTPLSTKDLAAALVTTNDIVAMSANPTSLISSRLATFLKRPWTSADPCPVTKEIVSAHPKTVYYYLRGSAANPPKRARKAPRSKRILSPPSSNADSPPATHTGGSPHPARVPSPEPQFELGLEPYLAEQSHQGYPSPASSLDSALELDAHVASDFRLISFPASPPLEEAELEFKITAQSASMQNAFPLALNGGELAPDWDDDLFGFSGMFDGAVDPIGDLFESATAGRGPFDALGEFVTGDECALPPDLEWSLGADRLADGYGEAARPFPGAEICMPEDVALEALEGVLGESWAESTRI